MNVETVGIFGMTKRKASTCVTTPKTSHISGHLAKHRKKPTELQEKKPSGKKKKDRLWRNMQMKAERVERAAELRGIYFAGTRHWLNSMVGYGYEFYTPDGRGFFQSDTLDGAYREIMKYPKVRR